MSAPKFKSREDELHIAATSALMSLMNINAVLDLLRESGTVQAASFPEEIAGALRIMETEAATTIARVSPLV